MMRKVDSRSQTNEFALLSLSKAKTKGKLPSIPAAQLDPDEMVEVLCLNL